MPQRHFGVEEEFLIIDPATNTPVPGVEDLRAGTTGGAGRPDRELQQEQAEFATAPHTDLAALAADLTVRRERLSTRAAAAGLAVAATASSPLPVRPTLTDDPRYARMRERFAAVAQEQLTCGMHVHVEVASRGEGVAVLDRMRPWLAVLLAMSANSPFWQGADTGYHSYRTVVWGRWPSAGPTEAFGDVAGYDSAVEALRSAGVILDPGMVYFDARLSAKYPTVEIRVADVCTDVEDALCVAALCRALVDTASAEAGGGRPAPPIRTELLRGAAWSAARFGTSGELVDPLERRARPAADMVDRLADHVDAAIGTSGDGAVTTGRIASLLRRGTGATRQRRQFERTGDLGAVVADLVTRTAGPR